MRKYLIYEPIILTLETCGLDFIMVHVADIRKGKAESYLQQTLSKMRHFLPPLLECNGVAFVTSHTLIAHYL